MHSFQARAPAPAQWETVPSEVWERRLERFQEPWRHRVCVVANGNVRLLDLALSFPALLFAIAAPRLGVDTAPVIRAIVAGERLKRVAALAQLPMWLRVLPPEAFTAPIPALSDSAEFAKQVVNFIPRSTKAMPQWLHAIGEALALSDEAHALWIAREFASGPRARNRGRRHGRRRRKPKNAFSSVKRLCLWAWYSTHAPDRVSEHARWSPAISLSVAETRAWHWLDEIDMQMTLGEAIADTWFEQCEVDGYTFIPLRTTADLLEEATAMRNCVGGYATNLASNRSRLWSVRRHGLREATLELSQWYGDPLPNIYELRGIENATVSRELSLAARRWMMRHEQVLLDKAWPGETVVQPSVRVWREQWRPYWLAKRRIPSWLPLTPAAQDLWSI